MVNVVNFGSKPIEPAPLDETGKPAGGPANRRAESYVNLRKALAGRLSLPDSTSLQGDLTSIGYKFTSDGKLLLELKEDMRRRGLPSPDEGDAVALVSRSLTARQCRTVSHSASIVASNTRTWDTFNYGGVARLFGSPVRVASRAAKGSDEDVSVPCPCHRRVALDRGGKGKETSGHGRATNRPAVRPAISTSSPGFCAMAISPEPTGLLQAA